LEDDTEELTLQERVSEDYARVQSADKPSLGPLSSDLSTTIGYAVYALTFVGVEEKKAIGYVAESIQATPNDEFARKAANEIIRYAFTTDKREIKEHFRDYTPLRRRSSAWEEASRSEQLVDLATCFPDYYGIVEELFDAETKARDPRKVVQNALYGSGGDVGFRPEYSGIGEHEGGNNPYFTARDQEQQH